MKVTEASQNSVTLFGEPSAETHEAASLRIFHSRDERELEMPW